jgi:RNA polymerase sigma factor for flagellar operon FliA
LTVQQMWQRYKATHDPAVREQLILHYLPLVRQVAGRMAMSLPAHITIDDLESHGLLGLLDAVGKFEPGRGVKFETYASSRIRGAILDGLRAESWAPALQAKARELEREHVRLASQLGREPTDEELSASLGLTPGELYRRQAELGAAVVLSLDEPRGGEDEYGGSLAGLLVDESAQDPLQEALLEERKKLLIKALERLSEKERLVITLFYYEELTITEIAHVMNLSVARISQLHGKAVLRLRGFLSRSKQQLLHP